MPRVDFLLAPRARFGGQRMGARAARALGRANVVHQQAGARAQLRRHVTLIPDHWPLAALTRRVDAGDADTACWLRADPAHVRAGLSGATLLACGDMLDLTADEAQALQLPLRPLFGDTGFALDAPHPSHWYLRLPREAKPPAFVEPAEALGADVFEQVPDGEPGRRWRALLSEAQIVLHNHPINAQRKAQGRLPVNSLWFWGGGVLPDHHACRAALALSDDEAVCALALGDGTGTATGPLPERYTTFDGDTLLDLRHARDLALLERDWLVPALDAITARTLDELRLDFADGFVAVLRHAQRWRFWRRPLPQLQAA